MVGSCYCLMLLVCCELILAPQGYQTPLALLLLALCGAVLALSDLDFLAALVLVLYSAVFIFLMLLTLYWGRGERGQGGRECFILGFGLVFILARGHFVTEDFGSPLSLYGDSYLLLPYLALQAVGVVHHVFFQLWLVEAIVLNLYVLVALILSLYFLGCGVSAVGLKPHWRLRLSVSLRRQTRRRNSSVLLSKCSVMVQKLTAVAITDKSGAR